MENDNKIDEIIIKGIERVLLGIKCSEMKIK